MIGRPPFSLPGTRRMASILVLALLLAGCTSVPSPTTVPTPSAAASTPTSIPTSTPTPTPTQPPTASVSVMPDEWNDHGIFSAVYPAAYRKLSTLSLEEKVGQVILARCPGAPAVADLQQYHLGGFVLFEADFAGKTVQEVVSMIRSYQDAASIPMAMAVDEEGGTVVRISLNPQLADTPFPAPHALYVSGGLDAIRADASKKAALLLELGLNLLLAPVSDVSTDPSDYIYPRALGEPAAKTGEFVAAVVEVSQEVGLSTTLKHFPGYGNNTNTHSGIAIDPRPYSTFTSSDFLPFEAGIAAGTDCILVAHTIVESMDGTLPASLSPAVHRILRNDLHFTGIVMTDDLSMAAVADYTKGADPSVQALLAGNDMLLLDDYQSGYTSILNAVRSGVIPQATLDRAVFRILAWKYARGILT